MHLLYDWVICLLYSRHNQRQIELSLSRNGIEGEEKSLPVKYQVRNPSSLLWHLGLGKPVSGLVTLSLLLASMKGRDLRIEREGLALSVGKSGVVNLTRSLTLKGVELCSSLEAYLHVFA